MTTQRERDRLVALKKAKKKLITQKQAAEEIGVSERRVRRMLRELRQRGDRSVVHGLRGKRSNRRISAESRQQMVEILSTEVYRGFGPTLASEYLRKKHGIQVGREALRKLMSEAKLWRPKSRKMAEIHEWRERKARLGELVQWDTSEHD
jgi:transposase